MYSNNFPLFTKGKVVKKEALEGLRDFPHTLTSTAFDSLSDGIIFGFSIYFNKDTNTITVSKGAFKYKGNIILVCENEFIINEYGTLLFIKLIVEDCREEDDFKFFPVKLIIDNNELKENELELARFTLKENAVLRCKYDSFKDLRTHVNTLDITRCLFAGIGGATLHPLVLKSFGKALLESSSEAVDISFAFLCINSNLIHKDCIESYIAKKLGSKYTEYNIDSIYKKLVDILSSNVTELAHLNHVRGRRPRINL